MVTIAGALTGGALFGSGVSSFTGGAMSEYGAAGFSGLSRLGLSLEAIVAGGFASGYALVGLLLLGVAGFCAAQ